MPTRSAEIGQARALMPFAVAGWSEEEARAQFRKFRFARHGGLPYCVDCDNTGVVTYKCRPIYKCKLCGKQFSDTSGTPWARRKLPFRHLMQILARFAHHKQGVVALRLAEDLGVQYKTAWLWVHRMRAEIMKWASTLELSGEVEVDGAEIGGYIRPKNVKKKRTDLRRIPYRAKDRTFTLVAARQRGGGPIRTWVSRQEYHTPGTVKKAMARGTTVFADKGQWWHRLRGKCALKQVNHTVCFYTPDACTNQVESVWAAMRHIAANHRHIVQNYLDLYLADVAWTVGKSKKGQHEIVAEVMQCMSAPGRSELTGYYQGRKRGCAVVQADDTVVRWKPDPNKKPMRPDDAGGLVPVLPRRPLSKTWDAKFQFVSADAILRDPKLLPNSAGVYAIFLRNGHSLLTDAGYDSDAEQPGRRMWSSEGAVHVYTGESYALRDRVMDHLAGTIVRSNLRETILALDWDKACKTGLPVRPDRDEAEAALSAWLQLHATVGFSQRGYIKEVEAAILDATASPLNIERRDPTEFQNHLKGARRRFRLNISDHWPKPSIPTPSFRR